MNISLHFFYTHILLFSTEPIKLFKNFGMALAPWAFGLLADAAGTNIAIICGIAFSVLAALGKFQWLFYNIR